MADNANAKTMPAELFIWADLDAQFHNETVPLNRTFDDLITRQFEVHEHLNNPCPEASELLEEWTIDDKSCLPMWHAGVARFTKTPPVLVGSSEQLSNEAVSRREARMGDDDKSRWNAAAKTGEACPEWETALDMPVTITFGKVFTDPERKRLSTRDNKWNGKETTWCAVFEGDAGTTEFVKNKKSREPLGLSRHIQDAVKDGSGYVLGNCDTYRRANSVRSFCALTLDADSGHFPFDEAVKRAQDVGIAFLAYTSHSHMTTETRLNYDAVVKQAGCDGEPSQDQIKQFVSDKKGLAPRIVDSIQVAEMKAESKDGWTIRLSHAPIPKYRIIVPLAEGDISLLDLANTQSEAQELFASKVRGLSDMLGIPTDPATLDVSRFFYAGRHRPGAEHQIVIHQAPPIKFADVPTVSGAKSVKTGSQKNKRRPDVVTKDGLDVSALYDRYARRWMLADICEHSDLATSVNLSNGGGKFHVICPFADGHTNSANDGSTFVMNADDSNAGFAVTDCQHGSCKSANHGGKRHLVAYLAAWIDNGDLDTKILEDPAFMTPLDDDQTEEPYFRLTPDEQADLLKDAQSSGIHAGSLDQDLKKHFRKLVRLSDNSTIAAEIVRIADEVKHPLGKRGLNTLVQGVRADARKSEPSKHPLINRDDFKDQWQHGEKALLDTNGDDPALFTYQDDLCVIRDGTRDLVGERQFAAILNQNSKWVHVSSSGDKETHRHVAAPVDVVQHIFNRRDKPFPQLAGIKTTPYFARDGRRVDKEGYDAETRSVLQLRGLVVPRVSETPTDDEVYEALRLLFVEVFGDFPLGGMAPDEMLDAVMNGGECADAAHLLCMTLQPFVRDMIGGVTPVYAITKPLPGSGGGLLIELASTIAEGVPAGAQPMPTTEEELTKTITAIANHGANWCFFDNMNVATVSGNFASAITAPTYKARLLGSSRMVEAPLRHVWVMVANNIKGSPEILRRSVMIELDARVARPEMRGGWRHEDVGMWVRENRGLLVWSCLTIVQRWVVKGRRRYSDAVLSSFESWSNVMGGILRDAGIVGFLGNVDRLRSYAQTAGESGVQQLMDELATYPNGTAFRAGGTAKIRDKKDLVVVSIMDVLNSCGEDGNALLIDGMGYSKDGEGYSRSQKIADQFKDFARVPWECATHDITFAEHSDPQSPKQSYWVMTKVECKKNDDDPPLGV